MLFWLCSSGIPPQTRRDTKPIIRTGSEARRRVRPKERPVRQHPWLYFTYVLWAVYGVCQRSYVSLSKALDSLQHEKQRLCWLAEQKMFLPA